MHSEEKQRVAHLVLLLCYTFFAVVLTVESVLLGWEKGFIRRELIGLVLCWGLHIHGKVSPVVRQWIYFVVTMAAFVFYGSHKTSVYDMAPVMIGIIIIYYTAEIYMAIRLCVAVYFLVMAYDLVFVIGDKFEFSALSISRTLLHFTLVFLAGYLANILVRKRVRERTETEERIAALEEINRRTEDFLTNVSHELRTPINAVTGLTAVMLKSEEKEEKRNDIRAIQKAGQRLFGQIEDILDYTEIDTGRIRISEEPYMLSSMVNDIVIGNRIMDTESMPELIFDIDAKIPSILSGDGRKIRKIITHLVGNAIKFTKKGGVYVRIEAIKKTYGVNLCIEVSDTGIGIEEENISKITEKFYQSSQGRNRRAGGLGLGLPIVHGMVSAMEGFMRIESRPGSGTTVLVSVPQKVSDETPGMVVENKEQLCLACYLRPEKYEVLEVRGYYDNMISHMAQGLDLALHRVFDLEDLKKLISVYQLSHLFLGKEEYQEDTAYFEELAQSIRVILVAEDGFGLPKESRVTFLPKPFYCFPVVSLLNARRDKDMEVSKKERLLCPGVKVLVVDDEPMNLMVAEGIFKGYQMKVTTAESGRKALELCGKEDFDLIFLDHMMPEMDGVETLKQLRSIQKTDKNLTVIAFTANAVSGAREMFLQEGFDEFISKPIETLELERILKKMLPRSSVEFVEDTYVEEKKEGGTETMETEKERESETETVLPQKDMMECLQNAGIDTALGLSYCQGEESFYKELLLKFAEDAGQKKEEINRFYGQEDFANYRILVHALKSTSKMIGAMELSEMAKGCEDAAKHQDAEYINAHHQELLVKYDQTVRDLFEAVGGGTEEAAENFEGEEIGKEEFFEKLESLKESLSTFEEDKAQALISEMSDAAYQGKPVREMLKEIQKDVEDFEFDSATEKTEALLKEIKGGDD